MSSRKERVWQCDGPQAVMLSTPTCCEAYYGIILVLFHVWHNIIPLAMPTSIFGALHPCAWLYGPQTPVT